MLSLYKHGFEPQKLLYVVVPQEWHNRIGNENIDSHGNRMDSMVSEFANISTAEVIYLQRPSTITEAISHYLTLTNGLCIRE